MKPEEKVGAVLVVGGGIGGIQASLNLADSGYKVYLVEKSPAIGGVMAQLDKTFPTNDCAMCIISPKLVECGRHLNIEIMTCAATHGYMPLLGRDTACQAQVRIAVATHRKHFGMTPRGIWLPECAYRPKYVWSPPVGARWPATARTLRCFPAPGTMSCAPIASGGTVSVQRFDASPVASR